MYGCSAYDSSVFLRNDFPIESAFFPMSLLGYFVGNFRKKSISRSSFRYVSLAIDPTSSMLTGSFLFDISCFSIFQNLREAG